MMRSKQIIRLELKNLCLRQIRRNFRDVIKLTVKAELNRLYIKEHEYSENYFKSNDPTAKEKWGHEWEIFRRRAEKLRNLLSKSIIQCALGAGCESFQESKKPGFDSQDFPTNLDMVWIPSHKAWFCKKCSEILLQGDKLLQQTRHPDYIRNIRH